MDCQFYRDQQQATPGDLLDRPHSSPTDANWGWRWELGDGGWEWDLTSPPGGSDASPSLTNSALKCKLHKDRIFVGPITPEPPVLAYYRHPSHLQALNKYF